MGKDEECRSYSEQEEERYRGTRTEGFQEERGQSYKSITN